MERWERAALLFDAENIVTLNEKYQKEGVEFHPLNRFLEFDTYEALARWQGADDESSLVLRLRSKGPLNEDAFDRHAAAFFLGEKFHAYPSISHDGWVERAYAQVSAPTKKEIETAV